MLDKILAFGSLFDWITPLWALIQDFRHGPVTGFVIPMSAGWTPPMLRSLLQTRGIKVVSPTLFGGSVMFSVPRAQAEYAQYLLERERIPFRGGVREHERRTVHLPHAGAADGFSGQQASSSQGSPTTVTQPVGSRVDGWLDQLDHLLGGNGSKR